MLCRAAAKICTICRKRVVCTSFTRTGDFVPSGGSTTVASCKFVPVQILQRALLCNDGTWSRFFVVDIASPCSSCQVQRSKLAIMKPCSNSWSKIWVLLFVIFTLGSSIGVMSGVPVAMESNVKTTGTGKRKVVEHAVLFQLKANVGDMVKENMVHGLADLKKDCSKWVVAESAGLVLQPSQLKGACVGLFMRFLTKADLGDYLVSKQKVAMAEKFILPYTKGELTLEYEAEVDDNDEAVFRQGDAFKSGAERIVFIKVKNDTSQEDIDTMVKSLNDLNDAPELSSLLIQITAGTNFCACDQRFSHGLVVRCPSMEALQEYSKHPHHIGVISKTVWPIAENLLQADYIVDGSGARRSFV